MTKQELNRDIKRLLKLDVYIDNVANPELIKEFKRLYSADWDFKNMTAASMRIMLRLNVKHRIIPFHQFGLMIHLPSDK